MEMQCVIANLSCYLPILPRLISPIRTDNSTATALANKTIHQRMSRSMDMRFHWVRDRVKQGQLIVYWGPGASNKGDYYTKHFPGSHHRGVRYDYLHPTPDGSKYAQEISPRDLRGCANLALYLGTRLCQNKASWETDPEHESGPD